MIESARLWVRSFGPPLMRGRFKTASLVWLPRLGGHFPNHGIGKLTYPNAAERKDYFKRIKGSACGGWEQPSSAEQKRRGKAPATSSHVRNPRQRGTGGSSGGISLDVAYEGSQDDQKRPLFRCPHCHAARNALAFVRNSGLPDRATIWKIGAPCRGERMGRWGLFGGWL